MSNAVTTEEFNTFFVAKRSEERALTSMIKIAPEEREFMMRDFSFEELDFSNVDGEEDPMEDLDHQALLGEEG